MEPNVKQATLTALEQICNSLEKLTADIARETDEVIASGDVIETIKHFHWARIAVERTKSCRERLRDMADKLSQESIPDGFRLLKERTGQKPPIVIEGVGRVTVSRRWACTMLDKQAGFKWLRDTDNGSLITETVNASTLAAFAKDMVENHGKELPMETFKTSINNYTSITKI